MTAQTLSCSATNNWQFKIPIFTDAFDKPAVVRVSLGSTSNFLKYDTESGFITNSVEMTSLSGFTGTYEI